MKQPCHWLIRIEGRLTRCPEDVSRVLLDGSKVVWLCDEHRKAYVGGLVRQWKDEILLKRAREANYVLP